MPSKINFGEALATALASGLQGFGQTYLQKKQLEEQRAREDTQRTEDQLTAKDRFAQSIGLQQAQLDEGTRRWEQEGSEQAFAKTKANNELQKLRDEQTPGSPAWNNYDAQLRGATPYTPPTPDSDSGYRQGMLDIEKDKAKQETIKNLTEQLGIAGKDTPRGKFIQAMIDSILGYSEPPQVQGPPKPTGTLLQDFIKDALTPNAMGAFGGTGPFMRPIMEHIQSSGSNVGPVASPDTTARTQWNPVWDADFQQWLKDTNDTDSPESRAYYADWKSKQGTSNAK